MEQIFGHGSHLGVWLLYPGLKTWVFIEKRGESGPWKQKLTTSFFSVLDGQILSSIGAIIWPPSFSLPWAWRIYSTQFSSVQLLSHVDSLRPHGLQPAGYSVHGNSPGKNTGVGCLALIQGFFPSSVQFSSVAQSCLTLCNPMNCSTPGFPVHHLLPEFTQTHIHRIGDAIQPSRPLSSPSPPAPNPS